MNNRVLTFKNPTQCCCNSNSKNERKINNSGDTFPTFKLAEETLGKFIFKAHSIFKLRRKKKTCLKCKLKIVKIFFKGKLTILL